MESAYVDPFLHLSLIASLLVIDRAGKMISPASLCLLSLIIAVGMANHLLALCGAAALLFYMNPVQSFSRPPQIKARLFIALFPGVALFFFIKTQTVGLNTGNPVTIHMVQAFSHNFMTSGLGACVLSVFQVFGPALAILLVFWDDASSFLRKNQHLAAFGAANLLLFFGHVRILLPSLPVFLLLIAHIVEKNREFFSKTKGFPFCYSSLS